MYYLKLDSEISTRTVYASGVVGYVNFGYKKYCPEVGREAYGYLEYNRAVTKEECEKYNLVPSYYMNGLLTEADSTRVYESLALLTKLLCENLGISGRYRLFDDGSHICLSTCMFDIEFYYGSCAVHAFDVNPVLRKPLDRVRDDISDAVKVALKSISYVFSDRFPVMEILWERRKKVRQCSVEKVQGGFRLLF